MREPSFTCKPSCLQSVYEDPRTRTKLLLIVPSDLSFVKPSKHITNYKFLFSFLYLYFHQKSILAYYLSLMLNFSQSTILWLFPRALSIFLLDFSVRIYFSWGGVEA